MNTIANTVIFTAGRAFALPVWYAVTHIFGK